MPGCGRYQLPATGTALLIPRGLLCLVHAGGDDDCGFCLGTMGTETTGTVLEYCGMLCRVTKTVVAGLMLERNIQAADE